jgi:hypothetical protein
MQQEKAAQLQLELRSRREHLAELQALAHMGAANVAAVNRARDYASTIEGQAEAAWASAAARQAEQEQATSLLRSGVAMQRERLSELRARGADDVELQRAASALQRLESQLQAADETGASMAVGMQALLAVPRVAAGTLSALLPGSGGVSQQPPGRTPPRAAPRGAELPRRVAGRPPPHCSSPHTGQGPPARATGPPRLKGAQMHQMQPPTF